MASRSEAVKKMAELLKLGAVMLPQKCPVKNCNLPLFKLRSGEIVCPTHGRVYLVRSDEEAKQVLSKASLMQVLDALEKRVIEVLNKSGNNMLSAGYREIIGWLEVLERIIRIRRELVKTPEEGKS
ncbi:MAG: hypothetical protein DRO40_07190 [Thermoprotei archaeon]|nr:MAG: hypothetical protein DRO40_07190 [Thermoprotei archaeon]